MEKPQNEKPQPTQFSLLSVGDYDRDNVMVVRNVLGAKSLTRIISISTHTSYCCAVTIKCLILLRCIAHFSLINRISVKIIKNIRANSLPQVPDLSSTLILITSRLFE